MSLRSEPATEVHHFNRHLFTILLSYIDTFIEK